MCYWHFFSQFHLEKTKTVADINASNIKPQARFKLQPFVATWPGIVNVHRKNPTKPKLTIFMLKK